MRKKDLNKIPLSPRVEEIIKKREEMEIRLKRIEKEFKRGFEFLLDFDKAVTIFGSARAKLEEENYKKAEQLAFMLAKDGFSIITGGGPGIMEAANKGASEAGGRSIGINIILDKQQRINKYVNEAQAFYYFFSRKVMLAFASQAYVFFPGGFGTLDEFFELTTLVQTGKIKPVPIILVSKHFWKPILDVIKKDLYIGHGTINKDDMDIYILVETSQEACNLIKEFIGNNHN